jgi:hypothetical protein
MKKTTLPHEVIYTTALRTNTQQDGAVFMLLALDDFSQTLFEPTMLLGSSTDEQLVGTLVNFMNGINKNYDRNKHAQATTYYTDMPAEVLPIIQSLLTPDSQIIHDPKTVEMAFKPVLQHMNGYFGK